MRTAFERVGFRKLIAMVGSLTLALASFLMVPRATAQEATLCVGTIVGPADSLSLAVQNASEGETLCISGHHRLAATLVPKANMTLWGVDGAILDGSKILTSYVLRNGRYVFPNQTQNSSQQSGKQCNNYPRNCYNDGVFFDGVALLHVPKEKLGPGKYFFDYTNNRVILADKPLGHTVELTKSMSVIGSSAPGVVIRDLVVENARTIGVKAGGPDWRILNVESRWNHTVGLSTPGDRFHVSGGHYHHNGQYGLTGPGADFGTVEGIESDHNDQLRFGSGPGGKNCWAAGESKWVMTTGLVVRDNHVHDGYCHGFWIDINNQDTLVENNRFENNAGHGLFQEISYRSTIRNNVFVGNRHYDLVVASSPDNEVYGNTFNGGGFHLLQQAIDGVPRGSQCPLWDPEPCFHLAINNSIYNNIVTCGTRTCATASSMGVSGFFENNTIDLNTYSVDAPGLSQWRLDDSSVTFESWQGRGFDQAGLVLTP